MKKVIVLVSLVGLMASGIAFGQTTTNTTAALNAQAVQQAETVTTADLGVTNPGLLPTNPFYFIKEFSRNVQRVFTFNPVAKAQLEVKITNEKAAEAKKIQETVPNNDKAIAIGVNNYTAAQNQLKSSLELLSAASSTPSTIQLFDSVASSTVLHQKLLDEIGSRASGSVEVKQAVDSAKVKIDESAVVAVVKDNPGDFAEKLKDALTASRGSVLKDVRSIEIINNIEAKAPEAAKRALINASENISNKLKETIQGVVNSSGSATVQQMLKEIPSSGDITQRTIIVNKLQQITAIPNVKSTNVVSGVESVSTSSSVEQPRATSTVPVQTNSATVTTAEVAKQVISTEDCGKENEKVNRDSLTGPVTKQCCYGLKEDRGNTSYSICYKPKETSETAVSVFVATSSVGIANPASTYCVKQGYKNQIITNADGSQSGVCVFNDGSKCEEWAYYRGECKLGIVATSSIPTLNSSGY